MDSFIKKIFDGKVDDLVHTQFQKFSKGEFRNKAMVNASISKDKISIVTTYEYASDFVRMFAEKVPKGKKVNVTGVIVSTRNLREAPELNGLLADSTVKQFMGIKQFKIEKEMSGEEIIKICDLLPNSFLGLSFGVDGSELKIKQKAPKSAKPSSAGDKPPVPDFCKVKTNDKNILNTLVFDVDQFKKVSISHDFIITDLVIPKNEKDPAKMREMAKRKGKIVRRINIDGKEIQKVSEFEA